MVGHLSILSGCRLDGIFQVGLRHRLVEQQVILHATFFNCVAVTATIGAESWDVSKFDMKPFAMVGNGCRERPGRWCSIVNESPPLKSI